MQLEGATPLETRIYNLCLRVEQEMPASELETEIVTTLSDAGRQLQVLRGALESTQRTALTGELDGLFRVAGLAYASEVVVRDRAGDSVRMRLVLAGQGDGLAVDLSLSEALRLADRIKAAVDEHLTMLRCQLGYAEGG
jgi:hypothetical protein